MKYRVVTKSSLTLSRARRALSEEVNKWIEEEGYRPHGDVQLSIEAVPGGGHARGEMQYVLAQAMVKGES